MIDPDNPRLRKVLILLALVAAIYLAVACYVLIMQSAEMNKAKSQICDDLEKNPESIGIRSLGETAYTSCDCNKTENGTWDCKFDERREALLAKNLSEMRNESEVKTWAT